MPRVLRIINRLNLGGPTWNAAILSRQLAPEFETLLVSGNIADTEASSEFIVTSFDLKPVYIRGMYRELNPVRDVPALLRLQHIIRQFRPHIVHTHAAKAGALGRIAAWMCGVPVVVHTFHGHVFHSYFSKVKSRMFVRLERFLANRTHAIVAISELQKKELVEQYRICREEKVAVIPLGLDLERFTKNQPALRKLFRQRYGLDEPVPVISIVGRLVPVKNHRMFLDALYRVKQHLAVPFRVFVVGDGEERRTLEQHCRRLGLAVGLPADFPDEPSVTFTSWIEQVEEVYAGSDIIALTSLNEGTPVSVIEAQAAGRAVVAANVGGVADLIADRRTGLLTRSNDAEDFAQALLQLLLDPELRASLGAGAAASVPRRHDQRRMVEAMAALYRQLLQG